MTSRQTNGPIQPASNETMLDARQWYAFRYFLHEMNLANGLVADRTKPGAPASIAAVGFAPVTNPGDIDLKLTDVVLPGMDGRQLSERVRAVKPGAKVVFMSGYTADVIVKRGVLEENVAFIGKLFTRDDLARKVREVLGT